MSIALNQIPNLSRAQKEELILLLEEQKRRAKFEAKQFVEVFRLMYPWQREFITATATYHECCLMAANQIGKSLTGCELDAAHLLGDYPTDWDGHKFDFPPLCWGLGYSMEKTRDLLQKKLFGSYDPVEGFVGGLIPKERIVSWIAATGTQHAMREVRVKHRLGISVIQFWSYTQGQHAIMGDVVDWVHVDEEPKDPLIRPQLITRTINGDKGKGGRIVYTFTPENGRTELVIQFMDNKSPSQFYMQKGWDDAPHITLEARERLMAAIPKHQLAMRSKGDPMLGHGRIYSLDDEYITCDPIPTELIPKHWYVLDGMDFGWDHPQSHIRLYEDRDNDVIYLARSWKARETSAATAWQVVKDWGPAAGLIPTAWPHDGLQHEKGRDDARQQRDHYAKAGFNMLETEARWLNADGDPGSLSVEQGIFELGERMRSGKFKVFRGQVDFFNEFRQYHRNEQGKIVKSVDDILDAIRTAYMMRRFGLQVGGLLQPFVPVLPPPIRPIGARR